MIDLMQTIKILSIFVHESCYKYMNHQFHQPLKGLIATLYIHKFHDFSFHPESILNDFSIICICMVFLQYFISQFSHKKFK